MLRKEGGGLKGKDKHILVKETDRELEEQEFTITRQQMLRTGEILLIINIIVILYTINFYATRVLTPSPTPNPTPNPTVFSSKHPSAKPSRSPKPSQSIRPSISHQPVRSNTPGPSLSMRPTAVPSNIASDPPTQAPTNFQKNFDDFILFMVDLWKNFFAL